MIYWVQDLVSWIYQPTVWLINFINLWPKIWPAGHRIRLMVLLFMSFTYDLNLTIFESNELEAVWTNRQITWFRVQVTKWVKLGPTSSLEVKESLLMGLDSPRIGVKPPAVFINWWRTRSRLGLGSHITKIIWVILPKERKEERSEKTWFLQGEIQIWKRPEYPKNSITLSQNCPYVNNPLLHPIWIPLRAPDQVFCPLPAQPSSVPRNHEVVKCPEIDLIEKQSNARR